MSLKTALRRSFFATLLLSLGSACPGVGTPDLISRSGSDGTVWRCDFNDDESGSVTGVVYDVDYLRDLQWTQILLQLPNDTNEVLHTDDARMQTLLEVSFEREQSAYAQVVFDRDSKDIQCAVVIPLKAGEGIPPAPVEPQPDPGLSKECVLSLKYDGAETATLLNDQRYGFSQEHRAQTVLETAIATRRAAEYFDLVAPPADLEIKRVKVNSTSPAACR